MAIQLEALDPALAAKPIAVLEGRPRVFKVMKHGHAAGTVTIVLTGGQVVATNRSERPLLVNGKEHTRCALKDGDTVVIGKDTFRVFDSAKVAEEPQTAYLPTPELAHGQALATRASAPPPPPPPAPAALSTSKPRAPIEDDDLPPLPATATTPNDAGESRRRRSISASMHSVVDQPKPGLLNRVSSVFSGRSRADRGREEELQKERHQLLEEVGRQVIAGHALGIPDKVFADLLAGRQVTIRPDQVPRVALERWRELTQRVALLDAEIAALRRTLGLGADLGAVALTAPADRNVLKQREDKVFETLDSLPTQDLDGVADEVVEPASAPPGRSPSGTGRAPSGVGKAPGAGHAPSAVSGRSRISGRRRHQG